MSDKTTITFSFLYKNGHEDVYRQEVTQENAEKINRLIKNVLESMREDVSAVLTLGNGVDDGMFVRLQDVCRVKIKEENKLKTCIECGGKLIESSECWVLSDGYEVPIFKCKECGKEAN